MKNLPLKLFFEIGLFGCTSAIPFSLLYSSIIAWLTEASYPLSIVTSLAISRIAYGFKYLWAPLIDMTKIPFLSYLGKRKSWMFLTLLLEIILILSFSIIDLKNFSLIYIVCIILGFVSASFDIAFDAYRIDIIKAENQGYAVASAVTGYRLGSLISSAGALFISSYFSWKLSFFFISAILFTALVYIPFLPKENSTNIIKQSFFEKFMEGVYNPFKDFLSRKFAFLIIIAILLYKLGGVLLGFVSLPFYLEIGYSKVQIASIVKVFGLGATILGSFIGGYVVSKFGLLRALIYCGLAQAFVHSVFIWLHYAPISSTSLIIAISVENIGSALGTSAEVAYISAICNKNYSATQYALLSSLASLMNSLVSFKSGNIIEQIGWDAFFIITVLLSLPALLIFKYISNKSS